MKLISLEYNENKLTFETDPAIFSPSSPDTGSLLLLSQIQIRPGELVLDLGCGYGLIGIICARQTNPKNVFMSDIDPVCSSLSIKNAARNGVGEVNVFCNDGAEFFLQQNMHSQFNWILSNPPYHTDFSVARRFIESGFKLLKDNGRMVLVVKRLDWYKNKLTTIFGQVSVYEDQGYFVLTARKTTGVSPGLQRPKKVKTTRKHQIKLAQTHKNKSRKIKK